jgi:hypothetical protein
VATLLASPIEARNDQFQIGDEGIQQRALADAGWTDKCAELPSLDRFRKFRDPTTRLGGHEKKFTRPPIDFDQSFGEFSGGIKIHLVQDENRFDPGCARDHESTVDVSGWLSGLRRNHDSQDVEICRDGALASSGVETAKHAACRKDGQAIAHNDHAIPGHCPLFRQEPDLPLAPGIEANQYGDSMMGNDPTGLPALDLIVGEDGLDVFLVLTPALAPLSRGLPTTTPA